MNTIFFVLFASLCGLSSALRFPVVARDHHERGLRMVSSQNTNVQNFQDQVYATNITVGGQEFLIQLDTGSSDLWVKYPFAPLQTTNTTEIPLQDSFGIGGINGTIQFTNVTLGPHFVPNQAFLNVTEEKDFDLILGDNIFGILGLAFDYDSNVDIELEVQWGTNQTLGRTFLSNVFAQNSSSPNMITILLGRASDPEYNTEGVFTIGEYDPELADVANQPQLQRYPNYNNISTPPRWSVVMDGMTVNGQAFSFNTSGVPGVPAGAQVAILDTGYTFPPIPGPAVDFIYSSIDGAYFDESSGLWIVPCENSTTLEFQFGNQSYPVHPLDITTPTQINNTIYCVNTYRASTLPVNNQFDMILGDAFLKNVYASFDYGHWNPENNTGIPFIQLLSTTDMDKAWAEFDQVRSDQVAAAEASATPVSASVSSAAPTATATTNSRRSFSEPMRRSSESSHRSIPDCLTPLLETYGAFMMAVMTGAVMVFVMCCAVGLALAVRMLARSQARGRAAYLVVDAKEVAAADPEAVHETVQRSYHDY
ncbi:aspartic peptidase domain-containing protein [Amylocystis lapponica]|nr:aspartic peptidase domain-containing protein [Amylocystis lapponica]